MLVSREYSFHFDDNSLWVLWIIKYKYHFSVSLGIIPCWNNTLFQRVKGKDVKGKDVTTLVLILLLKLLLKSLIIFLLLSNLQNICMYSLVARKWNTEIHCETSYHREDASKHAQNEASVTISSFTLFISLTTWFMLVLPPAFCDYICKWCS